MYAWPQMADLTWCSFANSSWRVWLCGVRIWGGRGLLLLLWT